MADLGGDLGVHEGWRGELEGAERCQGDVGGASDEGLVGGGSAVQLVKDLLVVLGRIKVGLVVIVILVDAQRGGLCVENGRRLNRWG